MTTAGPRCAAICWRWPANSTTPRTARWSCTANIWKPSSPGAETPIRSVGPEQIRPDLMASPALHGRANRICGHRLTAAERFWLAGGGVLQRLPLDLRVQLGAEQNNDGRHPHPHHEADGGAERAVGGVVVAEFGQ